MFESNKFGFAFYKHEPGFELYELIFDPRSSKLVKGWSIIVREDAISMDLSPNSGFRTVYIDLGAKEHEVASWVCARAVEYFNDLREEPSRLLENFRVKDPNRLIWFKSFTQIIDDTEVTGSVIVDLTPNYLHIDFIKDQEFVLLTLEAFDPPQFFSLRSIVQPVVGQNFIRNIPAEIELFFKTLRAMVDASQG